MTKKQIRSIEFYNGLKKEFYEIFDENGKRINGVKGIQIYCGDIIVYTENAIYTNNPKLFQKLRQK